MAYQALYRKYRPKNFDEVVGQDVVIKTLKNALKTGKTSHAYMFSGPRGVGKTSIAKILAKTLNCTNLKEVMHVINVIIVLLFFLMKLLILLKLMLPAIMVWMKFVKFVIISI